MSLPNLFRRGGPRSTSVTDQDASLVFKNYNIIDGDLKPHRMLCAAKLCGIREFANSDVKVVTGCTSMPGTKDKFCFKHRSEETPVRTGKDVSSETREKLKKHRKDLSASEKAQNDNIYI